MTTPRRIALALAVAGLLANAGCGAKFPLPNEVETGRVIPSDKSYQMLATWTGMTDVKDILLTQGTGSQLFILFQHPGSGTAPRGEIRAYPTTRPTPLQGFPFPTLFNPSAICSGGDGVTVPSNNRLFVLDQGDTCLARANPVSGDCGDTTGAFNLRVHRFEYYWRVREYRLLASDTVSTFTDTTLAYVQGIAADDQGRVYVSGTAILSIPSQTNPNFRERLFQFRVFRYIRGGPPDPRMPGSNWRRDPTWEVEEGSGIGTLQDPRGLFWSPFDNGSLYAADFGKNWVQRLSDTAPSTGSYFLDGAQTPETFNGPEDVAVDLQGFVYIADTGTRRVLRFDSSAIFVQRVDVEPNATGQPLRNPVAVAADDSLVYVADPDAAEVIRYKRRP